MKRSRKLFSMQRRRGAVAVMLAVTVPVIIAFAALTVDVGVMYNAKADLQRCADAAALAGASQLVSLSSGDPLAAARQCAKDIAYANKVLATNPIVTDADITFGKANIDPVTKQVFFTPTNSSPDAVRVVVRKTANSPNGALPLYFARIFGRHFTDVQATATAGITPRDIAIVSDISGSLTYDSQFKYWQDKVVNLYDVWDALPGGADDSPSTWAASEVLSDPAQSAGPAYGFFKRLGFGDDPADRENYSVSGDPGLIRLANGERWSDARLRTYLADQQYSSAEISAIMNTTSRTNYQNRVALALGLATWNSGISGGRWDRLGLARVGNRDTSYSDSELTWEAPFLSTTPAQARTIWRDYIDRTSGRRASFPDLFGIKTLVDYTLEYRRKPGETPELAATPVQPMQAIKDATAYMVQLLTNAQSFDQISLEVFSTYGTHQVDLTHNFADVTAILDSIVPDGNTNIGQGIARGAEELTSDRARVEAKKILLMITDGQANMTADGRYDAAAGKAFAISEAQQAAALGIELVTISVGQGADLDLCDQIAALGHGVHFHAEGEIDEYNAQLLQIFATIGGRRTVALIE
ncbi:MAG: VWA domain-containing protein [Phycisphaerales bacterium]|nr:VWA domain-containing protein [Phycisphaerales bacterium]